MAGRGKRTAARGAAAVEFAIILPVLMLLIFGAIDWGYFFFVEQLVTNAAREGARQGSIAPPSASTSVIEDNAETTAEAYLSAAGLTGTAAFPLTDAATATSAAGPPATVTVVVRYPVGSITGFLDIIVPSQAYATAVMRR